MRPGLVLPNSHPTATLAGFDVSAYCCAAAECNYGEATIPLDQWFGTFRDGKSAADGKISSIPGASKESAWVTALTAVVGTAIGLAPVVPLLQTGLKQS